MAANPFLFTEDPSDPSPQSTASSNPFLMDDDSSTFVDENPFFTNVSQSATTASTATNPFAFDPMDLEPAEATVPKDNARNQNVFMETTSTSNNFFNREPVNFFTTTTADGSNPVLISTSSASPQKPTELELAYTTQSGPIRPPPPVQSKATQDLLMSVMGEMDATSSHLLNKIPPTRSPSPVSMRDLQSPSPTPETNFGDLLGVGDAKPVQHGQPGHQTGNASNLNQDFMSMSNDINQNPPLSQPQPPPVQPQRPAPPAVPQAPPVVAHQVPPHRPAMPPTRPPAPARPPRPAPPQKPPLPAVQPMKQEATPTPPAVQPEPQPVAPASNAQQQSNTAQNEMDLFGVDGALPHPKIASNADILNLYNVKPKKPQPDLLCDDTIEPNVITNVADVETSVKVQNEPVLNVLDDSTTLSIGVGNKEEENMSTTPVSSGINTANAMLSPASNDMHMDTSDSQSKGSVSSVTFNPFAAPEELPTHPTEDPQNLDNVFEKESLRMEVSISAPAPTPIPTADDGNAFEFGYTSAPKQPDDFDAFAEKFDAVKAQNGGAPAFDAFAAGDNNNAWGNDADDGFGESTNGFGNEEPFDSFLAMQAPQPTAYSHDQGFDDDEEKDFSVVIRPKTDQEFGGAIPILAPPPAPTQSAFSDSSPRFNPFDQQSTVNSFELPVGQPAAEEEMDLKRTDSQESPSTPLFDEDTSQPLEPFPRTNYQGEGWEMYLRQPNKKKITGQRFWKKIFVKLVHQSDCVLLQLFNQQADKDPFQELPLQPCYSVSDIGAQQYDQFGKIFTLKLQYIFYKERPGVRPGQVKKAERITNKLSQFAAYAIQGDYQGVKEFGSDLKKLGLPVEHAPQVSQLMKLGSLNYEDLKQFSFSVEEALFTLQAHRDRALHYKMEEVQVTLVDELYVEQSSEGHIEKQIARVRLFFLGFLTGMPDIELGLNDMRRQGKEVVGRHDIIPVATEEWIRLENVDFHSCIQLDEFENTHIVKFKPPDACYIELLRFRVRPPKNRELPLQLKAQIIVTGTRIELRADVLVPGFTSRKLGQIPCEDVMIRFPIPECWIYMFRVEKHFRYGSVKSAHRRTGKIKGIERILGTMETPQENLIEVTSGQAKYEHQHRAIVWRCPRLPKEGQGAYTTHNMVCKIALTSYDQMPEKLAEYCYVEFTMPATQVSHTVCRSVSLQNSDSDEPPEKYVRYLARHEYRVGIEHTEGENPNPYAAATYVTKPAAPPEPVQQKPAPVAEESSSDSD